MADTKVAAPTPFSETEHTAQTDRLSFSAMIQDIEVNYNRFFALAMPGELIEISVSTRPDDEQEYIFSAPTAGDSLEGENSLAWTAPDQPGYHQIRIYSEASDEQMEITVFVLRSLDQKENGRLGSYRIGQYEARPLNNNPDYTKPVGLIEYTPDMKNLRLSPHFKLSQFLCKQATDAEKKYLIVRPALIMKLEALLAEVNKKWPEQDADTLFIMSGYRTPYYNKSIGNVPYSRHVYGDASDVYVDQFPANGRMDDLNQDGRVTRADAAWLYDVAEDLDRVAVDTGLRRGGIGEYGPNAVRGPFVHVDTRGIPARWGR